VLPPPLEPSQYTSIHYTDLHLFEVTLSVIAAGSATRDLRIGDEQLSRLVQARDKLAHVYWLEELVPGYVSSLVETRVRPAVDRARELLGEEG
jgi:hypothetical protein